jgi:hypothetical protein
MAALVPTYNLEHLCTITLPNCFKSFTNQSAVGTFKHVETIETALKVHDKMKNPDSKIITEEEEIKTKSKDELISVNRNMSNEMMIIESAVITKRVTRAGSKAQKQMDNTTEISHTNDLFRNRPQKKEDLMIEEKEITYEKKPKIKVGRKESDMTIKRQNAMLLEETDESF